MLKNTFSWLITTLSLKVRVYLHSLAVVASQICEIPRNSPKIRIQRVCLFAPYSLGTPVVEPNCTPILVLSHFGPKDQSDSTTSVFCSVTLVQRCYNLALPPSNAAL